jgi:hypothetical protein
VVETSSAGWRITLAEAGGADADPGLLLLELRTAEPADPATVDLTANDVEYVARGDRAGAARVRIRHGDDAFDIPVQG